MAEENFGDLFQSGSESEAEEEGTEQVINRHSTAIPFADDPLTLERDPVSTPTPTVQPTAPKPATVAQRERVEKQAEKEFKAQEERERKADKVAQEKENAEVDALCAELNLLREKYQKDFPTYNWKKDYKPSNSALRDLQAAKYAVNSLINSGASPMLVGSLIIRACGVLENGVAWLSSPYVRLTGFAERVKIIVNAGALDPEIKQLSVKYAFLSSGPEKRLLWKLFYPALESYVESTPYMIAMSTAKASQHTSAKFVGNSNAANKDL